MSENNAGAGGQQGNPQPNYTPKPSPEGGIVWAGKGLPTPSGGQGSDSGIQHK